jgi:hypothetical protein
MKPNTGETASGESFALWRSQQAGHSLVNVQGIKVA